MLYSSRSYSSLPLKPGVYQFLDKDNALLYVGKAKDLRKRVSSYFNNQNTLGEKTRIMVSQIKKIKVTVVDSELESLLLEAALIKKYSPKYNSRLTDGKAYPLVRITSKDTYPKVLLARRPEDPKSLYFGPFPSSGALRMVLKIIRRIFPFQNVVHHPKKTCLYHHLHLCPCPEVFDSKEMRINYRKNIRHIINFLEGEKQKVLKELEKERDKYSKQEEFEKAKEIQKKIDSVIFVTSPFHKPFEYELNPNLRSDIRDQELESLASELRIKEVNVNKLHKIECYDISNTSGANATGSLVVFIDGEAEKSLYRRFMIRFTKGPNDFAMMQEVLKRRFKHTEWEYPDLIIIDGGKGQISAAVEVRNQYGLSIPIIGLAKREETIITEDFKEILLPKDSEALHFMQRIRDEAHRFAITYHRKLRSRAFLKSS